MILRNEIRLHQTNGYIELTLIFMKAGSMALQNKLETSYFFGEIIGKNKKMQHLFTQIQTAAAGTISVLIQGLGGTSTISIDIRVLAATNRDLEDAIRDGYFREDLYYRLAAFPIKVPPLRDRREDIPVLADHFLKKYAAAAEKPIRDISTDALQMLMQHAFPATCANWKTSLRWQFYMRQQTDYDPKASFYIRREGVHKSLQAARRMPLLFFRLTKLNGEPSSTHSKKRCRCA